MKDKGIASQKGDLLRIECRILHRTQCLLDVIDGLYQNNPFGGFYSAPKSALQKVPKKIKSWDYLLDLCSLEGVPAALAKFPEHKKTLLNEIKANANPSLIPNLKQFEGIFCRLLEASTNISCPV